MSTDIEVLNENEATVLQLAAASNLSLADILYLIQGTGTDRDKKMTLEQLRDFLQVKFTDVKLQSSTSYAEMTSSGFAAGNSSSNNSALDGNKIEFKIPSQGNTVTITGSGIEVKDNGGNSVTISKDNIKCALSSGSYFEVNNSQVKLYNLGMSIVGGNVVSNGNINLANAVADSVTADEATIGELKGETKFGTLKNGTKVQTRNLEATTATIDNVTSERVGSAKYVDTGIVALDTTSLANKSWQLMTNWEVGQVKHIYDQRETGTSTEITAYKSTAGTIGTLTFTLKSNYFFTAVCIGTITVEGTEYAQLIINNG